MTKDDVIKLPRLYVDEELETGRALALPENQSHYLGTVMRRKAGDKVRVFNGCDGEWLCHIETGQKKHLSLNPLHVLKPQPASPQEAILLFAPLKKSAMDWLVEKSVELGVTALYPVLTQNTDISRINEQRMRQQIIEAAEQCERLTLPTLFPLKSLEETLGSWKNGTIAACVERSDATGLNLGRTNAPHAFLIGPEGGFTTQEKESFCQYPFVQPVSLGDTVLRAETAAIVCLASLKIS